MNKQIPNELHNKLENFYQGFVCGVRVNYDTCHKCKHFTVRSGWGEYCKASEDFARELTASLKSWGVLKDEALWEHLRPSVQIFALEMERILKQNDHKGGWQDCDIQYLRARLVEEMGEYFAWASRGSPSSLSEAEYKQSKKELVDIANFAMMLWDRS